MSVLAWITLVWAGALVLVLAAGLVAILVQLNGARRGLAEVERALAAAARESEPVAETASGLRRELEQARARAAGARAALAEPALAAEEGR